MAVIAPIVELSDGVPADDLPGVRLVQQLIDTVTAHPEVREPLLRALLTEDFLVLPERVGRLQEQVSQLQEGFDDFRVETRGEFGRVNARIDANTDAIAENTRAIAENTRAIAENTRAVRRLEGHVGRWRGEDYENLCRHAISGILDEFLKSAVLADRERIKSDLENARTSNRITRAQYFDGLLPDIVACDRADEDEVELLLVGECSITFNRSDLETAYRRAKLIEQVTGVKTQAFLVTHYDWPAEIAEVARQFQVAIIQHQSDAHAGGYADE